MAVNFVLIFILGGVALIDAESVLFPNGEKFLSVDQNSIPEEDRSQYDIVKETGSLLYDSQAETKTLEKKLAMNIPIQKIVSQSGAQYFRAHPVFLKCAEQAILQLIKADIAVKITKGYITSDESSGSEEDQYHQSGSGLELVIADGSSGTVEDIAGAVLKACPAILERELRDLGLVIMADKVHFHMSETDSPGPSYRTDGYTGIADITSWAETKINEGLEAKAASTCERFWELGSGDQFPIDKTQEKIVGTLDRKITRRMVKDFKRLVQYQGSDIVFENSESGAGWCDESTGSPCPTVCANKIQGNSIANRCADRVMSSRLLGVLKKVAKKVKDKLGDKLKVLEAWDEAYEGHENGDSDTGALHYEGRAAKLQLASLDVNRLGALSKYAACFGADYVKHEGTYIYVSVKRMKTGGSKVTFPNYELLSVDVPEADEKLYGLPSVFGEKGAESYPLFDKAGRLDTELATHITIGQFVSKDNRYFRLKPELVECYRDVVYSENLRRQEGDPEIDLEVVRGYITNTQNDKRFDVVKDERVNTHNLGKALQLRYKTPTSVYTPYRLLYKIIDKCAARFHRSKMSMGVGLYADSVFVDMRRTFTLTQDSLNHLPTGVDRVEFEPAIKKRVQLAKDNRVVDPDDYATACLFQTAPKPQSPDFKHEHSEVVKRRRRRRRSAEEEGCVPESNTAFCQVTAKHREEVVQEITSMLDRKHYPTKPREDIMAALEGCFLTCGTCLQGSIWEEKTEHCNNFLHWVDWTMLNTQPDVSNSFVKMNRHACEDGNDCVENAPLFSLIAPSYWRVYRPDPARSVEEFVYSSANNPSPVMSLLEDIYGIQASGNVKFWVQDDSEMTALKRQLEVAMMYNKNVTTIDVYIEKYKLTKDSVTGIIEKAARTMAKQGCPEVTRATLAPYQIHEIPAAKRKRAAEAPALRHLLRRERYDIDGKWLRQNRHL